MEATTACSLEVRLYENIIDEEKGVYNEDGTDVPAGPGDVFIAFQGHNHGLKNTGPGPLVMIAVIAGDRTPAES